MPFRHYNILGQLICGKIITIIVATKGHILRLKCTKIYFGRGDPAEGAYSAPVDPNWISGGLNFYKKMGGMAKGGRRRN